MADSILKLYLLIKISSIYLHVRTLMVIKVVLHQLSLLLCIVLSICRVVSSHLHHKHSHHSFITPQHVPIKNGENLFSVLESLKQANISVCFRPNSRLGYGGFGDTVAIWNQLILFSLKHEPTLKFRFNLFQRKSPIHLDMGVHSDLETIFYRSDVDALGTGCRGDGSNSFKSNIICVNNILKNSFSINEEELVVDTSMETITDGDTIEFACGKDNEAFDQKRFAHLANHYYSLSRELFVERYWHNVNFTAIPSKAEHVIKVAKSSGRFVIAIHLRNGDVMNTNNHKRDHAHRYIPFIKEIANLPENSVSVVVVTEEQNDVEVNNLVESLKSSSNGIDIILASSHNCGYECALKTLIHAHALVASGNSGFADVAAMLSLDSKIVCFAGAVSAYYESRRKGIGRNFTESPVECARQIKSRLSTFN